MFTHVEKSVPTEASGSQVRATILYQALPSRKEVCGLSQPHSKTKREKEWGAARVGRGVI